MMSNLATSFEDALERIRRKSESAFAPPPSVMDYAGPQPDPAYEPAMDLGIGASGGSGVLTAPPPVELPMVGAIDPYGDAEQAFSPGTPPPLYQSEASASPFMGAPVPEYGAEMPVLN